MFSIGYDLYCISSHRPSCYPVLSEELDVLQTVRVEVWETAITQAATLASEYRTKAQKLYALKEEEIELSQAMAADIDQWHAQFPPTTYEQRDTEWGRLTRHLHRLPALYDLGAVRRRQGPSPWERYEFSGAFSQLYHDLRSYLGMEKDKGILTEEGRIALEAHQAEGRRQNLARELVQAQQVRLAKQRAGVV
jgi:hypothetical protein